VSCFLGITFGFGPFPIDKTQVAVHGLSSGGFFASQVHVALSSKIMGAAIFAGGPYYCAQDQLADAFEMCMYGIFLEVDTYITAAQNFASQGQIDSTSNLAKSNVFIYSGTADTVVFPVVVKATQAFYQAFNVKTLNTNYAVDSEHCMPTTNFGNQCTYLGSPYINNCNYDGAGAALQTIYSNLKPRGTANPNNIVSFDQSPYMPNGATPGSASMADQGFAYIPTACQFSNGKNNTCKLVFSFHGCQQTTADIGSDWYTDTGLNDWAESNNIIVIYPQVVKSYLLPSNPEGCWDWWGYTDSNYSVKSGIQIGFVTNMIAQL